MFAWCSHAFQISRRESIQFSVRSSPRRVYRAGSFVSGTRAIRFGFCRVVVRDRSVVRRRVGVCRSGWMRFFQVKRANFTRKPAHIFLQLTRTRASVDAATRSCRRRRDRRRVRVVTIVPASSTVRIDVVVVVFIVVDRRRFVWVPRLGTVGWINFWKP